MRSTLSRTNWPCAWRPRNILRSDFDRSRSHSRGSSSSEASAGWWMVLGNISGRARRSPALLHSSRNGLSCVQGTFTSDDAVDATADVLPAARWYASKRPAPVAPIFGEPTPKGLIVEQHVEAPRWILGALIARRCAVSRRRSSGVSRLAKAIRKCIARSEVHTCSWKHCATRMPWPNPRTIWSGFRLRFERAMFVIGACIAIKPCVAAPTVVEITVR